MLSRIGSFNLALPSEFMSHGFALNRRASSSTQPSQPTQTPQVPAIASNVRVHSTAPAPSTHNSPSIPTVASPQASSAVEKMPTSRPLGAVQASDETPALSNQPPMGTLLETDPVLATSTTASPKNAYTDDLLGLEFQDTKELPTPMQVDTGLYKSPTRPTAAVAEPSLKALETSLTSCLSIIKSDTRSKSILPSQTIANLEAAISEVQQKIAVLSLGDDQASPQAGASPVVEQPQQPADAQQQADVQDRSDPTALFHQGFHLPADGLANAVEQNTTAWTRQVARGTTRSILGEYVHRTRFHHRRDSIESANTMASISDMPALPERMQGVISDQAQAPQAVPTSALGERVSRTAFVSYSLRSRSCKSTS